MPRTASFDPYDFRNPRTVIAGSAIRDSTILSGLKRTYPAWRLTYAHSVMELTGANGIVVMKFGGTSVAGTEELKRAAKRIVAAREAGHNVVAVLSARGKTTDRLLEAAREISPRPDPREMDMLLSIGERESCALCEMEIN